MLTLLFCLISSLQLKTNIPEDLVPILAKDADKQKAIIEKAHADALIASTRTSPLISKSAAVPPPVTLNSSFANRRQIVGNAAVSPSAAAAALAARGGKIAMNIQDIPPFNPAAKTSKPPATLGVGPGGSSVPPGPPSPAFSSASQASAAKLNINAPAFVFKPNPNASAFRPVSLRLSLVTARFTRY